MSSRAVKNPLLKGYRRKRAELNLDLNTPPVENPEQEGSSNQAAFQSAVTTIALIDVEAIEDDDDVVFCSPSAFAEAKNKSRNSQRRTSIVDVDSAEEVTHGSKRRRFQPGQHSFDFNHFINLEGNMNPMVPLKKPAHPPKEPTFSCPICMGPFSEETSTKCGHIFCKACIRAAIATQAKCPTCRKRVTVKELIRVFLPATNSI
ncbi:hypothetical protein SAY87_000893 [Trapa incisa]|uniref:RING-type domain-containing protein n=1 Tax=Trapa incisa TaxID=236973 RepID=A0AAN7GNS5_9MYRT|nr:hypothetical protein SAY87_000893 [Trapa incisa]